MKSSDPEYWRSKKGFLMRVFRSTEQAVEHARELQAGFYCAIDGDVYMVEPDGCIRVFGCVFAPNGEVRRPE